MGKCSKCSKPPTSFVSLCLLVKGPFSCEPYWNSHPWRLKFLQPSGNHVRRALVAPAGGLIVKHTCEWIVHRGDVNVKNPQIRFGPFQVAMCSPKYIDFMKNIQVNCWCCCDNDLKFFTHQVTWAQSARQLTFMWASPNELYMLQTHLPIYLATIRFPKTWSENMVVSLWNRTLYPPGKRLHNYGKIHHAM